MPSDVLRVRRNKAIDSNVRNYVICNHIRKPYIFIRFLVLSNIPFPTSADSPAAYWTADEWWEEYTLCCRPIKKQANGCLLFHEHALFSPVVSNIRTAAVCRRRRTPTIGHEIVNCFEYICHCLLLIYLESKIWECAPHADVFVWGASAPNRVDCVHANGFRSTWNTICIMH